MKAQPGGVIRFTTCGERRKYKPAAAVHTAPAAAPEKLVNLIKQRLVQGGWLAADEQGTEQ